MPKEQSTNADPQAGWGGGASPKSSDFSVCSEESKNNSPETVLLRKGSSCKGGLWPYLGT